jgi:hypothetical protein
MYMVKNSSFVFEGDFALTDCVLSVLSKGLRGRRFHAFGGIMKEIAKELKLVDEEGNEDLMKICGSDDSDGWRVVSMLFVHWYPKFLDYFATKEIKFNRD